MSTLVAILTLGAILRVTRLLVADQITERPRVWLVLRYGPSNPLAYLATCPWCMSVWVGAAICTGAYWWADTRWWLLACLAATGSLLAGWAARWIDPLEG